MLNLIRFTTLLLAISCAYGSHAQSFIDDIDTLAYREIKTLKAQKADTIILFTIGSLRPGWDTLPGIGYVPVYRKSYLLYKTGRNIKITKLVTCGDEQAERLQAGKSAALDVDDDSLFNWLSRYNKKIQDEKISPYIYKMVADDNTTNYDRLQTYDAPPPFLVVVILPDGGYSKTITYDDLLEKDCDNCPENLNYASNVNTRLYELYVRLNRLRRDVDNKFVFHSQQ